MGGEIPKNAGTGLSCVEDLERQKILEFSSFGILETRSTQEPPRRFPQTQRAHTPQHKDLGHGARGRDDLGESKKILETRRNGLDGLLFSTHPPMSPFRLLFCFHSSEKRKNSLRVEKRTLHLIAFHLKQKERQPSKFWPLFSGRREPQRLPGLHHLPWPLGGFGFWPMPVSQPSFQPCGCWLAEVMALALIWNREHINRMPIK